MYVHVLYIFVYEYTLQNLIVSLKISTVTFLWISHGINFWAISWFMMWLIIFTLKLKYWLHTYNAFIYIVNRKSVGVLHLFVMYVHVEW